MTEFDKYFYTLNKYYRELFGCRTQRIAIRTESTCPNRDGTKASGGCIYCSSENLMPPGYYKNKPVKEQIIDSMNRNKKIKKFIAYFQDHTFTYNSIERMQASIKPVFEFDRIIGISIGTRPDTFNKEIINLLVELKEKRYLEIELGLQSANDKTLEFINRKHTVAEFVNAVKMLADFNIPVIAHIIIGLPYEDKNDFIKTRDLLNRLPVKGVKFHNLHILKNTYLEKLYKENKVNVLEMDEYIDILVELIKGLRKDIVVYRLLGEASMQLTIAPQWIHKKDVFMNKLLYILRKQFC
ncbi:MAG: TIGR01212 family radical SAM protein [Candidatus Hydrogenedentota bacterium]